MRTYLYNQRHEYKSNKRSYRHEVEKKSRKKSQLRRPWHIHISSNVSVENSVSLVSHLHISPSSKLPPILASQRHLCFALRQASKTAAGKQSKICAFLPSMENEDEEAGPHNPISDLLSNKTLTILSTAPLGLGLGFLYARSPQTVKPISTAIKVSEAALKGSRSLTAIRSPIDLLLCSQYLLKISFAASSRFNCTPALDRKKIKAYLGAVNLVRYMRFLPVLGIGVFDMGVLKIGYKLSKNFVKVLEGFLGVQLDSAVRNCVEVVDLFMKTASVTREVSRIADWTGLKERLKLGEIDTGDCSENSSCAFVKNLDFDCGLRLDIARVELSGLVRPSFGDCRYSSQGFGMREGDLDRALSSETCFSDLFCLSIPVRLEIVKHHL